MTNRLTVRRNCVHDNNGPGLWTDIDNRGTLYEKNLVYSNTEVGIYHEISFDAVIRDNTVANNGIDSPGWVFGGRNRIDFSTYHASSLEDGHWGWDNALQNWSSLRSYPGVEANGHIVLYH